MAYRMIQVGTGGFGEAWCRNFLPINIADGLIEVVAAVDCEPSHLKTAEMSLNLPPEKCYTDARRAFEENEADFCTIVVPPAHHEQIMDLALEHSLDILSEKPIADSLEGSIRIANKVKAAGRKMGVTMSHRFDQDKSTLREQIKSGASGQLDYLVLRMTCPCRQYGSWGKFRHEIQDPLLVEGGVHHLDLLADLAGAPCDTVYAQTWNPDWGSYAGDSQALVTLRFENGVRAMYEGAKSNAVGLNWWTQEYIRAECEEATLLLDHRRVERFPYKEDNPSPLAREGRGEEIPLLEGAKWHHVLLMEQFVEWLDGGEPMATNVEDNLQSVALVFAAVQSSRSGQPVKVQEMLAAVRERVDSD